MTGHRSETLTGSSVWDIDADAASEEALHLTLLWSRHQPDRLGEVSALSRRALFGRGSESDRRDAPKLEWIRQRPHENRPVGPIEDPKLSRQQWLLDLNGDRVTVENLGRRALIHNGVSVERCEARDGDTLGVDRLLLFLVEQRPRLFARQEFEPFEFGGADADGIVGESPTAWQLRRDLAAVARSDAHVLVFGESGSGKELAARAIHRSSKRGRDPFVSRSAATIPASLVEVELFGNIASYPNAGTPGRKGLVGAAHGGSLFLDELAELDLAQQANLLRVLDSGEYQRLGEDSTRKSDFRLIGATNRPPGDLKHDLVARCPERVLVPDLRARRADIPLLARHVLEHAGMGAATLQPDLVDLLVRHRYTHHCREVERLLRMAQRTSPDGSLAVTREVRAELDVGASVPPAGEAEIRAALELGESSAETARRLGLPSRFALYRLMKRYGIES